MRIFNLFKKYIFLFSILIFISLASNWLIVQAVSIRHWNGECYSGYCGEGDYCDIGMNTCCREGDPCDCDEECFNGSCINGVCVVERKELSSCAEYKNSNWCGDGYCDPGQYCSGKNLMCDNGYLCDCDAECSSGICNNGVCIEKFPSGIIKVNSAEILANETIKVNISTQENTVFALVILYGDSWDYYICPTNQTSCSFTWTFSESKAGTYTYCGYLFDYDLNGNWTNPECVEVTIKEPCNNECSYNGEKRCAEDSIEVCGNFDKDSCLEWKTTESCSYGCLNNKCYEKLRCEGTFSGIVKRVIDGDSLEVKGCEKDIRLSLVDTPEWYEKGYQEAKSFVENICKVGSEVTINQDDGQPYGPYERIIAKVICGNININAALVNNELGEIATSFCSKSEFAQESWAWEHGCEQVLQPREETGIVCSVDAYNCSDFTIWDEAQQVFEQCGGVNNDVHRLDEDNDGIACESLLPETEIHQSQIPSIPSVGCEGVICSYNAYNCSDFSTHDKAQRVYECCGGITNDIHRLDRDKDGLACESLP